MDGSLFQEQSVCLYSVYYSFILCNSLTATTNPYNVPKGQSTFFPKNIKREIIFKYCSYITF